MLLGCEIESNQVATQRIQTSYLGSHANWMTWTLLPIRFTLTERNWTLIIRDLRYRN